MNTSFLFAGRSEPIRLSAAKYWWDVLKDLGDTNIVAFGDERDALVALFPLADVQAIVIAKHYQAR
jgi:hypothetical protein